MPRRDTNKEIYEKICEMRASYKAENDKYWEEEKAFRDWYREDRRRKCACVLPQPPCTGCRCGV